MRSTADDRSVFGDWISVAKGIGIVLVVAGHFFPEDSPFYWAEAHAVIYSFHMPLFFWISGYLYVQGKYSYCALIRNKIKRLLYPFFTVAGTYLLVKFAVGLAVHLDHPVDIATIYDLIVDPLNSFAPLLWFVHALFIIFVLYPAARRFLGPVTIFILLLIINAVAGSKFLLIGKALAYMPYFALGVMFREYPRLFAQAVGPGLTPVLISGMIFAIGCLIAFPGSNSFSVGYPTQVFLAVAGLLLVVNASVAISRRGNVSRRMLAALGYYSMTIYLFHTLFESGVRILFLKILPHGEVAFPLEALIAISFGIIVPMLLEKELLRRWSCTRRLVLGIW